MKRTLAASAAVAALCAAFLAAPPAAAQGPAPTHDRAVAEALFEAGRALMDKGQYDAACRKFEASQRSEPAPGTVLNLANCYEKVGRLASAWARFAEAAQTLPPGDDRLPVATARAAALKPRLPKLELTLDPDAPRGTQVFRDDVAVDPGALGVAIPVDPGSHRVVVKAPGRDDAEVSIDILEGQRVERHLFVGAPSKASADGGAPGTTSEPSWWTGRRTAGFVTGGVGLAGLAIGLGLGGAAIAQKNIVSQDCNATTRKCTSQAGIDAASTGRTMSTASTVSFVVGAAALAGGVVLIVLGAPDRGSTTDAAPPSGAPSAVVRGILLPGGGALGMSGTF